jgi:RimJ/RimL family protein N-acetyltransferase
MSTPPHTVRLRRIDAEAAAAILAGRRPPGVRVADDYPTEFSNGIAGQAGGGSPLGPFFIHRAGDDVVVGEIGGGFVTAGVAEIGYAIVSSCRGRGYATDAVRLLVDAARAAATIERLIAHTPLDRPASARVVAKAGLRPVGERDDEHEGVTMRVLRWELRLTSTPAREARR